jgi:hypothetical protein
MTRLNRGIRRLLPLAFAFALIAVPAPQAAPRPAASAVTLEALHWQHENAAYVAAQEASAARAQTRLVALHFDHEDRLHRARELASAPHRSAAAVAAARSGFDWADALTGAGGAVALIALGVAANVGIRRRHSRYAHS